jgi:hypothetical protein
MRIYWTNSSGHRKRGVRKGVDKPSSKYPAYYKMLDRSPELAGNTVINTRG